MAQEKKIKRTLIVGHNYDVFRKNGTVMEHLGTIIVPSVIRSIKEQKNALTANGFKESDILVLGTPIQKHFEMLESDFIRYAIVVSDSTVETEEPEEQAQE
jgi:hypothetical protein